MSSPPRTRPSTVALTAIAIGALVLGAVVIAVVAGVNVIKYGETFVTGLYPPPAVTDAGPGRPRPLHDRLPDRGRDLLRRRGPDPVVRHPLPPQAGRRHPAAPDPRQQRRRGRLDDRPDAHRRVPVHHLVADAQRRGRHVGEARDEAARAGRPVPVDVRLPRRERQRPLHPVRARPARTGASTSPSGRTIEMSLNSHDVIHAFYVPQFLFKRDVVPGRTNKFEFNVHESMAGQTFRGQCAELCGRATTIMTFEVHAMTAADFDAWLAAQGRRGRRRPRPPPPRRPRAPPHDHRVRSHEDRLNGHDHAASDGGGAHELLAVAGRVRHSLRIRGIQKIPKGALLIASKHQSLWETFALITLLPTRPSFSSAN